MVKHRAVSNESALSNDGFLRVAQIVGDRRAKPPIPPLIPIARSAWWAGVKSGRFPQPVKLGPRTTAWRVKDIRLLLDRLASMP